MMISFKWRHYKQDMILMLVRLYLVYPLSYHDIEELALEHGLKIDQSTINLYKPMLLTLVCNLNQLLDINIFSSKSVSFNKLTPWFYLIAHQCCENFICCNGVLYFNLQHSTYLRIHRSFP